MPQKLGQHFLKDRKALEIIARLVDVEYKDILIEIGPGHGELTKVLVNEFENKRIKDYQIIAIEKDRGLVDSGQWSVISKNLKIISGDALKVLSGLINHNHYKIVGNIPYYITGHLLRVIGELENKPSKTILLIQKEVAQRICAVPPRSNILSLSVLFWSVPKIALNVPKESFSPPPDVESAVIELKTRENIEIDVADRYYNFIKSAFKQPRKTLLNNLISSGYNHQKAAEIIHQLQLPPMARPQELRFESVLEISKLL